MENIEINKGQNIVEFYNSMADGKVSEELLEAINPEFIFSTNEKTMRLISDGEGWRKE